MRAPFTPSVPALRWSAERGYDVEGPGVAEALSAGVPGFILFGGSAEEARDATRELSHRAGRPLLFGSDLERGAGQQFRGATPLPPLGALGALGDLEVLEEAGALTAREALAMGIPWIFAPVADLALEEENPIVGTRALGPDPSVVGRQVRAWIRGCVAVGGIPCVKHFPGHGRTREDSHDQLPVVSASRAELEAADLVPFRSAVDGGVPSVMTAHVAYPALDPSGTPATLSRPMVTGLLRGALGFRGVVVTDALIMAGAGDPARAVVGALHAGADLLLYPPESLAVEALLAEGLKAGRLDPAEMAASRRRVEHLVQDLRSGDGWRWGLREDRDRAASWASRSLVGPLAPLGGTGGVDLTVVDDDVGGPYPPPARETFRRTLVEAGVAVGPSSEALPLLCLYGESRAWKGRAGLSPGAQEKVERWSASIPVDDSAPSGLVVVFGGPRVVRDLPQGTPFLMAWGGEPLMQEAAATWVVAALRRGRT